jgi:hypothetical protein
MSLADTGRSQQNHVGCLMHEPHHAQLANLPFIDRRLECKIRPIEGPQTRQVGQLQPGLQVTLLSSWASIAVIRAGPDSPHPVVENLLRHSAPYLERGFVHPQQRTQFLISRGLSHDPAAVAQRQREPP